MHRRIILLTGTTATLLAGPLATGAMAKDASIGEVAAAVNSVWIVVAAILVMFTVGMRVTPSEEREGLDRSEHGGEAYPEFVFQELVASPRDLDPVGTNGH
jgi:ammonia channel protein AmtB